VREGESLLAFRKDQKKRRDRAQDNRSADWLPYRRLSGAIMAEKTDVTFLLALLIMTFVGLVASSAIHARATTGGMSSLNERYRSASPAKSAALDLPRAQS
jgi:hypothetical protein